VAYTFDHIEARDPNIPSLVASNAAVVIFAPGDAAKTPLTLTDNTGSPLPNPVQVNAMGYGPAFISDLDRVAWEGGGYSGFFTSYEGMKEVAVASQVAAETAAAEAAEASAAALAERIAAGEFTGAQGPQGPAANSNMALDEDGVPYFVAGSNAVQILADTDGAPYFV
jgi:hypothetical protein